MPLYFFDVICDGKRTIGDHHGVYLQDDEQAKKTLDTLVAGLSPDLWRPGSRVVVTDVIGCIVFNHTFNSEETP